MSDSLLEYAKAKEREAKWDVALRDIFFFIDNYIPKKIFNLETAAPQQKEMFRKVMEGSQYFAIRAPRKGGKTICVAIIAVWLVLRDPTYRVFILSGSKEQAEWLYAYCTDILWPAGAEGENTRNFFSQFLKGEPKASRIVMKTGGWIRYSAASEKSVNAPTADCLIMDEFVIIPAEIIQEAWPMIRSSPKPRRFLLSTVTPNKQNTDTFLDLLEDAQGIGFEKVEWTPGDCPFLQHRAAAQDDAIAQRFLSPDMYVTQYQGGLPKKAGKIFPQTFLRGAFKAVDPNNPGFLVDGTPYEADPEKRVFQGDSKAGVDWGFDHETVFIEGYRGLNKKIVVYHMVAENNTSPTDWADLAERDSELYDINDWVCDSAGAFQNRELQDRQLNVTKRAFGHLTYGKEWMIGVAYFWLSQGLIVIPDTPEFKPLKDQLIGYRRDQEGKPKKGDDDKVDAFLCFCSNWDPRYYREGEPIQQSKKPLMEESKSKADWTGFKSPSRPWQPDNWNSEEVVKYPWERR